VIKKQAVVFFRFFWRKQPAVFFPVLLEKKAACPFLSGSVGEKKQAKSSQSFSLTAIHGDVKGFVVGKTKDLFL
jgi:hypothetical protein